MHLTIDGNDYGYIIKCKAKKLDNPERKDGG